jgi:hypothetical protein
MKGLLFDDHCGGGSEYIVSRQKWCIQVEGSKYHVDSRAVTLHGEKIPEITIEVTPCNGSCQEIEELPDDVWEKAQALIKTTLKTEDDSQELKTDPH